jgi:hypothetical protein
MNENKRKKGASASLEDRFVFLGDGMSLGSQSPLKPALFEVEDTLTGASRRLKLWRKTGGPIDEDLRRLWLHELRQVQRVMAYAGARDVIVDVIEQVEDSENFGVVLESVGGPLSSRILRVGRYHWLQNLDAPRPRTLFWQNIRRISTALGIVHAQGLVHGAISADCIMTEGADEADFQLGGFEWSLWVGAGPVDRSHATVSGSVERSSTYSFAEDWRALGLLVAECLRIRMLTSGGFASAGEVNTPIMLNASERALLKRLIMPTRLDYLDSVSMARSIDDIIVSVAQATAIQPGTFILGFSPSEELGQMVYTASNGAIPVDEFRQQLNWIQADLDTGATLIVPRRFNAKTGTLGLVTDAMFYRLRAYRQDGAAQWDIAVSAVTAPRGNALPFGVYDDFALPQSIKATSIPRQAEEMRTRLGPGVLDWSAFGDRQPDEHERVDVKIRRGLLLIQIVEAVIKALEIYPIEILETQRRGGRRYVVIRAEPDNDRDKFAKKIKLSESAIALRRLFEDDAREADANWRISQTPNLGASQRSDVAARFVDVADADGRRGYLFEVDEEVPADGPFFLRSERDVGAERVISRRLANIKALNTRVDLAEMLDDPWRVRRSSRETIDENNEQDVELLDLDVPKRKALVGLWSTLPSYFVVGPPGVGKTKLATETVRRRFTAEPSTRMLISAQGHDALDHLQEKIGEALRLAQLDNVIAVRSTTPDRRASSDEEVHLLGIEYLERLLNSPLSASAPPILRQRVETLWQAANRSADRKSFVSREERSGLHAISSLLLDGANIVFSTTNSPDIERLVEAREQFDWVLIEEAAKATGPELVGPLMLSGRRLLIGDHNQLSPFGADRIAAVLKDHGLVTSAIGLAEQWVGPLLRDNELEEFTKLANEDERLRDISGVAFRLLELFQSMVTADEQRLIENPSHRRIAATLTEQRRMDPAIARIISHGFYDDKLETYDKRIREAETVPFPFVNKQPLPASPVVVVDFKHVSSSGSASRLEMGRPRWHNPAEIDSVIDVLRLVRAREGVAKPPTLAVLSPYTAQVDKLKSRIESLLNSDLAHIKQFSPVRPNTPLVGTVDSFQGSEADLVIISLVRNNPGTGFGALGFLRDQRRMNVALSRAKSQLIVVGSLTFLEEAVKGVNPDEEKHALSFLTKVVDTIRVLGKEKREATGMYLSSIVPPESLRGRR